MVYDFLWYFDNPNIKISEDEQLKAIKGNRSVVSNVNNSYSLLAIQGTHIKEKVTIQMRKYKP